MKSPRPRSKAPAPPAPAPESNGQVDDPAAVAIVQAFGHLDRKEIIRRLSAEPLPGGRRPGTSAPPPPVPLLRTTFTVCPPWGNGSSPYPITIEVIVLAEAVHVDDETATRDDLPELREAGWINHGHGGADVFIRTLS